MRWRYVDDVPRKLLVEANRLIRKETNPFEYPTPNPALVCWLDRNLPCTNKSGDGFEVARRRFLGSEGMYLRSGAWTPGPREIEPCCKKLRWPPRFPWAFKDHCRSAKHIALKYEVEVEELRRQIRKFVERYEPRRYHAMRCAECGRFINKNEYLCPLHRFVEDASQQWKEDQLEISSP